jgi:oxalyl-CoA decarboxylase
LTQHTKTDGGDRRTPEERFGDRFPTDPSPTDLNPKAQHNLIMAAFGGLSYHVKTLAELESACNAAFTARSPALIDISIDPTDGKASGRLEEVDKKQTK